MRVRDGMQARMRARLRGRIQGRIREQGFTLIEVLVALAIFGIVALALLTQSREQVRMAASVEDRLLAHWVASNTLTDLQTAPGLPDLGSSETSTVMAGRDWFIIMKIGTTPASEVRNVEVSVSSYDPVSGDHGAPLVNLIGFVGRRGN